MTALILWTKKDAKTQQQINCPNIHYQKFIHGTASFLLLCLSPVPFFSFMIFNWFPSVFHSLSLQKSSWKFGRLKIEYIIICPAGFLSSVGNPQNTESKSLHKVLSHSPSSYYCTSQCPPHFIYTQDEGRLYTEGLLGQRVLYHKSERTKNYPEETCINRHRQ